VSCTLPMAANLADWEPAEASRVETGKVVSGYH
jgi:hypothetical protein